MGKYTQNKVKYEKKAGYRTINSMIPVIFQLYIYSSYFKIYMGKSGRNMPTCY